MVFKKQKAKSETKILINFFQTSQKSNFYIYNFSSQLVPSNYENEFIGLVHTLEPQVDLKISNLDIKVIIRVVNTNRIGQINRNTKHFIQNNYYYINLFIKHKSMSNKRIQRELFNLQKDPQDIFKVPINQIDESHWQVSIFGPQNSPYSGGEFILDIIFPKDYPFKPPRVKFLTKIYHLNINQNGAISIDILDSNWDPSLTINHVCSTIYSLLIDPNPYDPLQIEIAQEYKIDRLKFEANAREWTKMYAQSQEFQTANLNNK